MEYTDKTIRCAGCGQEFVWSAPEQFAYAERGLRHEPRRCRECRRGAAGRRSAGRESVIRCAECGKEARVPFVPHENRPVLCAECHARGKGARPSESE